jgi:hypothetical protein
MDLPVTWLLFAFGVSIHGDQLDSMPTPDDPVKLIGETVTVSFVSDPALARGQFRLENHGSEPLRCAVETAWLDINGQRRSLNDITVYDLTLDQSVPPGEFALPGGASMSFLLGFPRIGYEPQFGASVYVGLSLQVNNKSLQAESSVRFEQRIPRGDR